MQWLYVLNRYCILEAIMNNWLPTKERKYLVTVNSKTYKHYSTPAFKHSPG